MSSGTGGDPESTSEVGTGSRTADGVTPDAVREQLRSVLDPCSAAVGTDLDVVEMGLIEDVAVEGGDVTVSMRLTSPGCMMVEHFARAVDDAVEPLPGVESVTLETDAGFDWHRGLMSESAQQKRQRRKDDLAERYGDEVDGFTRTAGDRTNPDGGEPSPEDPEESRVAGPAGRPGVDRTGDSE